MRSEIKALAALRPLPRELDSDDVKLKAIDAAVRAIKMPISDEEAIALVAMFGSQTDDCFGLSWSVLHIVELAPGWPIRQCLEAPRNEWTQHLYVRASRGGKI